MFINKKFHFDEQNRDFIILNRLETEHAIKPCFNAKEKHIHTYREVAVPHMSLYINVFRRRAGVVSNRH